MKAKIALSKADELIVRNFAQSKKISFQKALELILNKGVVHLQKKDDSFENFGMISTRHSTNMGVVHQNSICRITIISMEVA